MATYVVTAPDGKEYEVNAPEGATQEHVLAFVQQNYAQAAQPQQRSVAQDIGRQAGLTARAAVTGLTAIPAMMADPVAALVNQMAGRKVMEQPSRGVQNILTAVGLPQPETGLERAVQAGTAAMAGLPPQVAAARAAPALAPMGQNLLQQTAAAGAAGTAAQATQEAVQEATENPLASVIAGLAAGTVVGGIAAKGATAATTKQEPLIT